MHRYVAAFVLCACVIAIPSAEARPRSLLDGITRIFQPQKAKRHHPTKVSPAHFNHARRQGPKRQVAETVGPASYYGDGEKLSPLTANGEVFNPALDTCAHRRAKFGVLIRIRNLDNGKTATCRVNDRGPAAWTGRILDVSKGIAAQLGMLQSGVARVSIGVIE